MNNSMLIGAVVGGAAVLSVGAVAGYKAMTGPSYAEVINVAEVKEVVHTPERECGEVAVTHKKAAEDQHRIAGTLIGGVLGGVLGHQVGGGNGKTLATVAGAAAGGYAGNQVQKNMQDKDTYTTNEERCKTVNVRQQKVVGYDVKYKLDGKEGMVRMDHRPEDRIPVKDGQLVLNGQG